MNWLIRDARPEDAAGIVHIFNPIIEAGLYTTFDTPFNIEAERDFIRNLTPRSILHVAIHPTEHNIVGFQGMSPFPSYSSAFEHVGTMGTFVDLTRRRQGIARSLFAATFEAAIRLAYEKIFTYVRADNPTALVTYLNQGFRIVGTAQRHARIRDKYIDEIMIEKLL